MDEDFSKYSPRELAVIALYGSLSADHRSTSLHTLEAAKRDVKRYVETKPEAFQTEFRSGLEAEISNSNSRESDDD